VSYFTHVQRPERIRIAHTPHRTTAGRLAIHRKLFRKNVFVMAVLH
jgi:hypothetical protein